MKEKQVYEVYVIVGGSGERVCVFTGTSEECYKKCEQLEKNPRKLAHLTRDYMRGWGSGIDGVFMTAKA